MAVPAGQLEIETSDHIVLRYTLAGGGNRGVAALIDAVLVLVVVGALSFSVVELPRRIAGVAVLALLGLVLAYFVLLEWLWNGQTVGKRIAGLRVISGDGSPASFSACFVRNLVRVVDLLPGFYGLGLLTVMLTPQAQRLGDLAAGTYVVRAPRPRLDWLALRTLAPGGGASADVRGLPGEMQRLVREFVAREAVLAPADRARVAAAIALRLRPLVRGVSEPDDVRLIQAVARGLRAAGGDSPPR